MKSFVSCFVAAALLLSTACTTPTVSTTITALNAVSDAASVAVVVATALVAANQVSPADAATIATYASAVSTAAKESVSELNSTDTNLVKIANVTGYFALVAAPAFGPAASPQIIAVVNALSVAVQLFLNQLQSSGALTVARMSPPHARIVLQKGDKTTLKVIVAKSDDTIVKAKLLGAK